MNKNKNQIKLSILALVILVSYVLPLPSNVTFAATPFASEAFLSMLSRIWIVPAKLAGVFMNNDMIYGSALNLDVYLWKMWNIIKNFANYTLGFTFIFLILKTFFKGEPNSVIKQYLPKIFVAGVLIQMSWFLLGALIDVSNIMTAAIASLPARMDTMKNFKEQMKSGDYFKIPEKIVYNKDVDNGGNKVEKTGEISAEAKDKMLTVDYNNIGGPLVFLGYGIMKFQDYNFAGDASTTDKSLAISTMLKALLIFMFVLPLILLLVVNVIRMVYIWIWIVFSPFVVLLNVMGKDLMAKLPQNGILSQKSMGLSNVIGLIFQPVAVVGSFVLAIFFISGLAVSFTSMSGSSGDGVKKLLMIQDKDGGGVIEDTELGMSYQFTGNFGNSMKGILGGGLGYLILGVFTIMLLWGILKVGFKASAITAGITDKFFKFAGQMAMATPIIPGGLSLGAMKDNLMPNVQAIPGSVRQSQSRGLESKIQDMFGVQGVTAGDLDKLRTDISKQGGDPSREVSTMMNGMRNLLKTTNTSFNQNDKMKQLLWDTVSKNKQYFVDKHININDAKSLDDLLNNASFSDFLNTALSGERINYERNAAIAGPGQIKTGKDFINNPPK